MNAGSIAASTSSPRSVVPSGPRSCASDLPRRLGERSRRSPPAIEARAGAGTVSGSPSVYSTCDQRHDAWPRVRARARRSTSTTSAALIVRALPRNQRRLGRQRVSACCQQSRRHRRAARSLAASDRGRASGCRQGRRRRPARRRLEREPVERVRAEREQVRRARRSAGTRRARTARPARSPANSRQVELDVLRRSATGSRRPGSSRPRSWRTNASTLRFSGCRNSMRAAAERLVAACAAR